MYILYQIFSGATLFQFEYQQSSAFSIRTEYLTFNFFSFICDMVTHRRNIFLFFGICIYRQFTAEVQVIASQFYLQDCTISRIRKINSKFLVYQFFDILKLKIERYNLTTFSQGLKEPQEILIRGLGFEESFQLNYVNRICYQHEQQ